MNEKRSEDIGIRLRIVEKGGQVGPLVILNQITYSDSKVGLNKLVTSPNVRGFSEIPLIKGQRKGKLMIQDLRAKDSTQLCRLGV